MKFLASTSDYMNDVRIALLDEKGGRRAAARPVTLILETIEDGQMIEPLFTLKREHAISLLDALYEAGLRPSKTYPDDARIEAIQYHLEDMRRLVFKGG